MGFRCTTRTDDPGPSFYQYAQTAGLTTPPVRASSGLSAHATTVIAVRYDQGVVMVGDRQATGNYIASRDVRKIEAADRFTAIAISGTAARGIEFIRMAQLSFEHYEKMTDSALSLEGKANYLSPIIQRNNLSSPLIVIPLLAGWDPSHQVGAHLRVRRRGRLLRALRLRDDWLGHAICRKRPATRFQHRPGPRSRAGTWRPRPLRSRRQRSVDRRPDFVRNIYPMMVTITSEGFQELDNDDVAARFRVDQ